MSFQKCVSKLLVLFLYSYTVVNGTVTDFHKIAMKISQKFLKQLL